MKKIKAKLVASLVFGGLCLLVTSCWPFLEPYGDPPDTIAVVQDKIDRIMAEVGTTLAGYKGYVIKPNWSQIRDAISPLTWHNRQIMEAKAMLRVPDDLKKSDGYDEPWDLYSWPQRFENASKEFRVETTKDRILRSIKFGVIGLVGGATFALLAVSFLSFLWYFFLDRLGEVSAAIKGQHR